MIKTAVIIPARLGSERLLRKPLQDLCGEPLILRVYRNACRITATSFIAVATDSDEIRQIVEAAGGKCFMTPDTLRSGSDRVYYVAKEYLKDYDIIINFQGDEPFMSAKTVDELIKTAESSSEYGLLSAYYTIGPADAAAPSNVKVVVNLKNEAVYFSRSPIPYNASQYKKHLGLYAWRRELLEKFSSWEKTPAEKNESLEQLRVIENGYSIKMIESSADSLGIDTEEDLACARKMINEKTA